MKRSRVRFACSQFLPLLACQSGYDKPARNVIAPSHAQPAYEI